MEGMSVPKNRTPSLPPSLLRTDRKLTDGKYVSNGFSCYIIFLLLFLPHFTPFTNQPIDTFRIIRNSIIHLHNELK